MAVEPGQMLLHYRLVEEIGAGVEHLIQALLARHPFLLGHGERTSALALRLAREVGGPVDFEGLGSGGAYSSSGTGALDWQVRDLYNCPNVRSKRRNVYVNTGEERPMRAPGHPQCAWALEQMMDSLAEAVGMDPVAFRLKNVPEVPKPNDHISSSPAGSGVASM